MNALILNETKQLIRIKGLSFTMDDLVAKLGISKKTIYQYYPSKEAIITQIVIDMRSDMEKQQVDMYNNPHLNIVEKMTDLLNILPTEFDLINPITLNQLKRNFPSVYKLITDMYHNEWTRFDLVYKEGLEQNIFKSIDLSFFKELFIIAVTCLPESSAMSQYNHKELVKKIVDQLLTGILKL